MQTQHRVNVQYKFRAVTLNSNIGWVAKYMQIYISRLLFFICLNVAPSCFNHWIHWPRARLT